MKDAKRNLARLVEQVLADAEPRIVVNDKGEQGVVMPLDEFNSWKETLYLLSSPANAAFFVITDRPRPAEMYYH